MGRDGWGKYNRVWFKIILPVHSSELWRLGPMNTAYTRCRRQDGCSPLYAREAVASNLEDRTLALVRRPIEYFTPVKRTEELNPHQASSALPIDHLLTTPVSSSPVMPFSPVTTVFVLAALACTVASESHTVYFQNRRATASILPQVLLADLSLSSIALASGL